VRADRRHERAPVSRDPGADSVVFGFRPQAFVTRANVVGLSGVRSTPVVETITDAYGNPVDWPM